MIYNHGRDNVRLINFGKLVWFCRETKDVGRQTFPIIFDGRNKQHTCGIEGGFLLDTSSSDQSKWLIDSRGLQVPLMVQNEGMGTELLVLEGSEDCNLGMFVNLSAKNRDSKSQPPRDHQRNGVPVAPLPGLPEGMTYETVDLNGRNQGIKVELLLAQRPNEIIDNNSSYVDVEEIVSVGKPRSCLSSTGQLTTSGDKPLTAKKLALVNPASTC